MSKSLEELREKLVELSSTALAVQEKADAEKRPMTDEDIASVEKYNAAFAAVEKEISTRESVARMESKLQAPRPRVTEAPPPTAQASTATPVPAPGEPSSTRSPVTPGSSDRVGTFGFQSFGHFAHAVMMAERNVVDPRLKVMASAPTANAQEATGADGGYLVPPDFRTQIMVKVQGEDSLLGRTDQQVTSSNSITVPVDETTPWQTTGGVQVYWEGEGTQISQSGVAFKSVSLRANKIAALIPVTDELLEDAPSLNAYLSRKVPEKLSYKINDALLNGDGINKPFGILKSPALVTQAAEGGQTAGTVNFKNVVNMYSRMYAPLRSRAVWLCNQDIEPQLAQLVIPASSGVSSPAYLPTGSGLVGNPLNGTLMGRPLVYTEAAQALGTVGDITLVDMSQYLTVMKSSGLRSDTSIHMFFDQGLTAFRFTMRLGGMPWWASSIARAKGGNTLSFAVALAAR